MRLPLALAATLLATTPALAVPVVGLGTNNQLVTFDTDRPMASRPVAITGVEGRLVGIDVRPADKRVYGLSDRNVLYRIDVATGRAEMASRLDRALDLGVGAVVDFNPVADRLRVIGASGQNYRINVDTGMVAVDGAIKYESGQGTPRVVAGAYYNSMAGATSTELVNIDAGAKQVTVQAPPNDGVQKARAPLSASADRIALDIYLDGSMNRAVAVMGRSLVGLDLMSGRIDAGREIQGLTIDLIDLTVVLR
ncbi:MAG: DUF4394 domain-containing protein [Alphaproteobacteria bacterium]|nr:MAG: DUF4394 domain-containing protein [Alphaproteobacteria bacterium]